MRYASAPKPQKGFTLVELMIALVLGLIVVGGALALFVSQRVTNRLSGESADIQNEARIAIDALARDMRGAGDFGCWPVGVHRQAINDTTRFYPSNGGLVGFSSGSVSTANFYDANGLSNVALPGADVVADSKTVTLDTNSDVVAVRGVNGMLTELSASMASAADTLKLVTPASGQDVLVGDVLIVTDCKGSSIFEVTGADTSAIAHEAKATSLMGTGNSMPGLGYTYSKGAMVGRLDLVWWFVGTVGGKKGLYRLSARDAMLKSASPQLVSDRIDTLKIKYDYFKSSDTQVAVAANASDYVVASASADAVSTAAAAKTGGWFTVQEARIEVLAKSTKYTNAVPVSYYFDNSGPITPTDGHAYLPLKMAVGIRNF